MPHTLVLDAVSTRLEAGWNHCPFEIEASQPHRAPANGALFLAIEFLAEGSSRASIGAPGANIFRDEGVIRFLINQPANASLRDGLALAAELSALFRAADFGGVKTFAPSPATLDRSRSGGNYRVLSVVVPYSFDSIA